ncbi:hypothetical protein GCM10028791_33750 [Echinicola sediminis]
MSQLTYLGVIFGSLVGSSIYYLYAPRAYKKAHKVLLFTLVFVFLLEAAGEYTASRRINNTLLYNICGVYLQSFLLVFYLKLLEPTKAARSNINLALGGIAAWGIFNSIWLQPIDKELQFFSLLPFGLLIIFLACRFFYRVLQLSLYPEENILAIPHFWIAVGMVFFYVEVLVLFGIFQFVPGLNYEIVRLWAQFNRLVAGLMYLSFGFSFYTPFLFMEKKLE